MPALERKVKRPPLQGGGRNRQAEQGWQEIKIGRCFMEERLGSISARKRTDYTTVLTYDGLT